MLAIMQRGLQMPNALELPRMLGAVIPLMRARDSVVNKFVALSFRRAIRAFQFLGAASGRVPRFSTVIRSPDRKTPHLDKVSMDLRDFWDRHRAAV